MLHSDSIWRLQCYSPHGNVEHFAKSSAQNTPLEYGRIFFAFTLISFFLSFHICAKHPPPAFAFAISHGECFWCATLHRGRGDHIGAVSIFSVKFCVARGKSNLYGILTLVSKWRLIIRLRSVFSLTASHNWFISSIKSSYSLKPKQNNSASNWKTSIGGV